MCSTSGGLNLDVLVDLEVVLLSAGALHSVHDVTISNDFCNPADGHSALFRIGELLVVSNQMLLVPRIAFHPFIVIDAFEHDLAETIVIGQIGHLGIEQLAHQRASLRVIMDLQGGKKHQFSSVSCVVGASCQSLPLSIA